MKKFFQQRRMVAGAVGILLLIHLLLAVTAMSDKSPTFDESVYLTGGTS